jgi:peptidoglycan/LPS O-acetylase OafA/YrhL
LIITNPNRTPQISYRADIDGLRAIAVLSVVGFHAFPKLIPGGFVGVDVFFVISGFLIASLILNGLQDGTFSYLDFYSRRVRRLFPALIFMLAIVWGLGWFVLLPNEYAALGRHMLGGAAFYANIQTYLESGYFDALTANKPLLHLWSLGVEEQFYIVFPTLLALLWRYGAMRLTLGLIGIASFVLNIVVVREHSSFTFYLPITRFWEFLSGGMLACLPNYDLKSVLPFPVLFLTPFRRNLLATTGLALILAGVAFASEDAFPGWWGLPPVLGAVLLIAGGPHAWVNRIVLANPGIVFIGLISYPLYLWHWPLLVLGHDTMRNGYGNEYLRTTALVAIGLSFVLAWLTYEFIEKPVRHRRPVLGARRVSAACVAGVVAVGFLGLVTVRSEGLPFRFPPELLSFVTPLTLGADYPPSDETRNNKGPLLVAYGDSHAGHLVPGFRMLQKERIFRLESINWYPCSPLIDLKPELESSCRLVREHNDTLLAQWKPDIVVFGILWLDNPHIERLAERIQFLQGIGVRRIFVIGSVPRWHDPPQWELYNAYRRGPLHSIPNRSLDFAKGLLDADREVEHVASASGARFISAYNVLCDSKAGCLLRLGNTAKDIVQVDLSHFSAVGSYFFVSHIAGQVFDEPSAIGSMDQQQNTIRSDVR